MSGINSLRAGMNPYAMNPLESWGLRAFLHNNSQEAAQTDRETDSPNRPLSENVAAQSGSSVMSGNFFQTSRKPSRYVASTIESYNQKTLQELSQSSGLFSILEEVNAFARSYSKSEIDSIVSRSRDKKLYEEVKKSAEEMKAELERKAAEAAAPKDANGEPIIVDARLEDTPAAVPNAPAPGESIKNTSPDLAGTALNAYVSAQLAAASVAARHSSIDLIV